MFHPRAAGIGDMQEKIRIIKLFECGGKCLHQVLGEVSNKADGVGNNDLPFSRKPEPSRYLPSHRRRVMTSTFIGRRVSEWGDRHMAVES